MINLNDACFIALYKIAMTKTGDEREQFLTILMKAYNVQGNG